MEPDARRRIERQLEDQEASLRVVVELIVARRPLGDWPDDAAAALAAALSEAGLARMEAWRARALRRHLFGPTPPAGLAGWLASKPPTTPRDRRRADRLRADLAQLVPLRSASGLLDAET